MTETLLRLFDTTALIDIYRGKPWLRQRFLSVVSGELEAYISVLTVAELWRGVQSTELERHEAVLSYFGSLTLEAATARLAGAWMGRYGVQGLGWMDALITATAYRAGLTILTRDSRLAHLLAGEASFELYTPG